MDKDTCSILVLINNDYIRESNVELLTYSCIEMKPTAQRLVTYAVGV